MRFSEVANRYAKALYLLAKENTTEEQTYQQLQFLADAIEKDAEIMTFLTSPLVASEKKEKISTEGLNGKFAPETKNFLLLLARKNRIEFIPEIVIAYQSLVDTASGVTRGLVRSATPLTDDEKKRVEDTVSKYTNKKVILSYQEDKSLIGGLVAEVGSYTFDDSLTSHLIRLNEELNRRAQ